MGKLIRELNIDDCPNCEFNEYTLITSKKIKCSQCEIEYTMQYIQPGASIASWAYDSWKKDPFTLMASSKRT